ncbi:hypothetical protein MMC12_001946 [Toensbergia leucococca]|nr:hypothetical protein [Toensbergia leucococca]
MALTLHKYLSTRDIIVSGRNAWAKDTSTWPTIVLLSASSFTFLFSIVTLAAYLISVRAANTANNVCTLGGLIELVAHMVAWISTAALYRFGKNVHDLWGWSCSEKAQNIQGEFRDVVDFSRFCTIQVGKVHCAGFLQQADESACIDRILVYEHHTSGYRLSNVIRVRLGMEKIEAQERIAKSWCCGSWIKDIRPGGTLHTRKDDQL